MMSLEEMGDKDIQGQNIRTLPTQAAGNLADIDMRALYDSILLVAKIIHAQNDHSLMQACRLVSIQ